MTAHLTDAQLDEIEVAATLANDEERAWAVSYPEKGYPQQVFTVGNAALVAECFQGPEVFPPTFAEHIAAADPPTVLAMVAEIRQLRAAGEDTP